MNFRVPPPGGMTQASADSIDQAHAAHTPFDEILPIWKLDGAVTEARFFLALAVTVANAPSRPRWTVDSEFRRAAERRSK